MFAQNCKALVFSRNLGLLTKNSFLAINTALFSRLSESSPKRSHVFYAPKELSLFCNLSEQDEGFVIYLFSYGDINPVDTSL